MISEDKDYYYWDRGTVLPLSGHYSTREFTCLCGVCPKQRISKRLLQGLDIVRNALDAHVRITSGFRCAAKQQSLRDAGYETAKGTSQHELGNAADIQADNMASLLVEANKVFQAVGAAHTFIHVDTRTDKPRRWSYTKS